MASPAALGSRALRAGRRPIQATVISRRGLAAAASGSFQYDTGEAAGVKFASRELHGAVSTLAVVAKAGTRYQPYPGFTDALDKFAFKSTTKRSTLRIVREVELLGGEVSSYHTRENLILQTKFLKDDLPYFAELLAEVISKTRFTTHELNEEVLHIIKLGQKQLLASPHQMAEQSIHALAFHRGLGNPLIPVSSIPMKYLDAQALADYSDAAYARSNIAVVANGAEHSELSKWVTEFFGETGTGSDSIKMSSTPSKYHGGEERIAHGGANIMIIGFPGSSSFTTGLANYKPEIHVLAALLGGQSSIKWSSGFTLLGRAVEDFPLAKVKTEHHAYSDAGLLTITLTGNARHIAEGAQNVVDKIKKISSGDIEEDAFKKAVAAAKFKALESGQSTVVGLEATGAGLISGGTAYQLDEVASRVEKVSVDKVKAAAKSLLESKASVSTVGDLYVMPFASDLGLNV